uniref:SSD domain-containing protein n=1 Tax=Globodera pallida TaxID=36090 RepID=A0A183BVE9_GLOPA
MKGHNVLRQHNSIHPQADAGIGQQQQQRQQPEETDRNNDQLQSEQCSSTEMRSDASPSPTPFSAQFSYRLHGIVRLAYRRWAHFVVAHPYKIILFCFILTAICVAKTTRTKHKNNIRGYTPYGSRSLYEFNVRDEFFDQSGVGIRVFVLILPRNGTNMLGLDTLRETVEVDSLIQHNLTIFNRITQRHEPFSRICRRFCTINEPVQLFYAGFKDHQRQLDKHEQPSNHLKLDYPTATVFGQRVNIQPNFFGIHFANASSKLSSTSKRFSNMDSVEMLVLLYRAERIGGWFDDDISDYEMRLSNYFKDQYVGQHIQVLTISTSYVQVEVDRAGNIIRSYFGIGLAVMILCAVVTNSLSAFFMHQLSIYRLPVAFFACLCPFMASGTALGLLFFAGIRNSSILAVTPFLILALGIDDAFLMIHSWQLSSKRRHNSATKAHDELPVNLAVAEQLAEVLEETGPAILISALTNIFADLVGAFIGSEEITLLCVGNIASIIVDFFYQITLFTAGATEDVQEPS